MKNFLSTLSVVLCSVLCMAEIPQNEKSALLAISASVRNSYNWDDQTPVEKWTGVTLTQVNGITHVTGLNMRIVVNGTDYIINYSDRISELVYLETLSVNSQISNSSANVKFNFDFNNIANITSLKKLDISAGYNSEQNPQNNFLNLNSVSKLANLEILKLGLNSSSFLIPSSFSTLSNLKSFTYKNSNINKIPLEIFNITSLEELYVETEGLHYGAEDYSADGIVNLTNLKLLSLSSRYLYYLPDYFYNLQSLESLSITTSMDFFFSDAISNYKNKLKKLYLNSLWSYYINPKIWSLENLEELNFSYGDMELPLEISGLKNLKKLFLTPKNTVLKMPETISELVKLEELYITNTYNYDIQDQYSENIFNIPNLKILAIYKNDNISENISKLQRLEHFQLEAGSDFSNLPISLGNINTLKKVDFLSPYGNSHSFILPDSYFKNWPNLTQLWITLNINADITNKFINNPELNILSIGMEVYQNQELTGKLNLCKNNKLKILESGNSKISEVDLRNNANISSGAFGYARFDNSKIEKFLVDDIAKFNQLITQDKITIQNNYPADYQVLTSSVPCERNLATQEINKTITLIYPNPVNNILNFNTSGKVEFLEVVNLSGQSIKVEVDYNQSDLSFLPKGTYIIKWKEDNLYKIDKIIKN